MCLATGSNPGSPFLPLPQELLQGISAEGSGALSDSSMDMDMDMDTESAMDEFTSNYTESSSSSGVESGSEIVAPEPLQGMCIVPFPALS